MYKYKMDSYTIGDDCEFTPEELELVKKGEESKGMIYIDNKPICEFFPAEVAYCKKVTGLDFQTVLQKMLSEISPDPWKAARELFDRFGEEYEGEDDIPGMTAYALQHYIDQLAKERKLEKL
jgi:hypothetical protein